MLTKLTVRNFKSLVDVTVEFPRLTVLFGPNAAGKSNLLDAIAALSGIGNARTLSDVLDRPLPVRGYAFEAFSFPVGGLPALVKQRHARFLLEADLAVATERYRYRVQPNIELTSGRLSVVDEYLALLGRAGNPKGTPAIERVDSKLRVRRKGKPAHPREEAVGKNHAILSDRSLAGDEYRWLEAVRRELGEWCTHYLDPGLAMRAPRPPADVFDIGPYGEDIGPFLYKLRAEEPAPLPGRHPHPALGSTERRVAHGSVGRAPGHARYPDPSRRCGVLVPRRIRGYAPRARPVRDRREPLGRLPARVRRAGERRASAPARPDRPPVDVAGDGQRTSGHRDHPLAVVLRRRTEAGIVRAEQRGPSQRPAGRGRPPPSTRSMRPDRCSRTRRSRRR